MNEHYTFEKQFSNVYLYTFKEFITGQRKIELSHLYLIINEDISPKIYEYLTIMGNIKFVDGEHHKYCGEVKLLINNFINYWNIVINNCVREADELRHTSTRESLLKLIKHTIEAQKTKQENFLKAFLPVENAEEQQTLEELEKLFKQRLEELKEMSILVKRFDKVEVDDFAAYHSELSILKKNQAFQLAHTNIANNLTKYTYRIRTSFEEILLRMSNNLKQMNLLKEEKQASLLDELYEANKDRLLASRQERHRAADEAEVEYRIQKIRERIDRHQQENTMVHLEEEVEYWANRLMEFVKIENSIKKIETELDNVTEYLKRYNSMRTTEYPGSKKTCWTNIGENYRQRKALLEQSLSHASKSLVTFFAVRGQDRIFYKDKYGIYAIDEYGHKMHHHDYGKVVYHTKCYGEKVQIPETDKYFFDDYGRYVLLNKDTKNYQVAPCTSTYNLNEDTTLLEKNVKDCGHSEAPNPDCQMNIKDPTKIELLPSADPVDIRQTLDPETVKYLWDAIGYILPEALADVGNKRPLNPIWSLGNRLFHYKYHKHNWDELNQKAKEADQFRSDVFKKRKEPQVAEAIAYKSKLVQRRKPEESDETYELQLLAAREAAALYFTEHMAVTDYY